MKSLFHCNVEQRTTREHCNGHIGNVFVRILERNSMIQKNLKKNAERVSTCWPTRFGPSLRAGDVGMWQRSAEIINMRLTIICFGKFREEHLLKFAGVLKGLFFGMTFHLNIRNCCICYIAPCDITRTSNDLA